MSDKWSALLHGKPSLINDEDWAVGELKLDDFPESIEDEAVGSSEVQKGRLVFLNMVGLTIILSNILQRLLCVRFQHTLDRTEEKTVTLLTRLKELQISLKDWFVNLPELLKMDSVASMKLSSVGYLRLAYLTVETSIHRLIVRTISQTEATDDTLVRVCRAAASERFNNAVDFIQRLQASHLASFWYFTSAQCCVLIYHFGRLLARTSTLPEARADFERKLTEYTWTLKVNGEAGTTFMKHALSMIDSSSRIHSLPVNSQSLTDLGTSPSTSHSAPGASFEDGDASTNDMDQPSVDSATAMAIDEWDASMTVHVYEWGPQADVLS